MSQTIVENQICVLGDRYQKIGKGHRYIRDERLKAHEAITKVLTNAKLIEIPCLCGTEKNDKLLATIDRFGLPISAVLCQKCGLIRLNPRWEDVTYIDIYQKYFWPLQMGSFEITAERFQLSVRRAEKFLDVITTRIDLEGLNVVEIGCSYGAGLYGMKDSGATLVGYDYDERILDLGKKYTGMDLRPGGLETVVEQSEKYDLVILRHVFEHFLDPYRDASSLKKILKKNGKVFIEVPGVFNEKECKPDPLMIFNAFHTYHYSLKTLTNVMETCGFSGDHRNDELIYSLWSVKGGIDDVVWKDRRGAEKTMNFLIQKERERVIGSGETILDRTYRFLKRLLDFFLK